MEKYIVVTVVRGIGGCRGIDWFVSVGVSVVRKYYGRGVEVGIDGSVIYGCKRYLRL